MIVDVVDSNVSHSDITISFDPASAMNCLVTDRAVHYQHRSAVQGRLVTDISGWGLFLGLCAIMVNKYTVSV